MIINTLILGLVMIAFTTFCSEEHSKKDFEFNGWLLSGEFFDNLEKVNCEKKEVDNDYLAIVENCNSFAYKKRKINPRAIAFSQELRRRIESDEK